MNQREFASLGGNATKRKHPEQYSAMGRKSAQVQNRDVNYFRNLQKLSVEAKLRKKLVLDKLQAVC